MNFNFNFNPENFGLGVMAGWATAYGIYRARGVLGAARDSVTQQMSGAQEFATRGADSRYVNDLLKSVETRHLVGNRVKLSEILVEPRFIPQPEFAMPPDDDIVHSVFHVVPHVTEYPYLQAPYNIETLSIEDLGRGKRAIAILGASGSGRTTALSAIALWSLGRVKFSQPEDRVQEQIDTQDALLPEKERNARKNERKQVEEMAMRALKNSIREDEDAPERGSAFRWMTPIYLHLANVNLDPSEYGREIDPAEPLVRAVQHEVSGLTSRTIAANLYQRLEDGDGLILIDGYDDLPPQERNAKAKWLQAFIKEYGQNFIIVTGPAQGYGNLVSAGFTPVLLREWHDVSYKECVDKWAELWSQISAKRRSEVPLDSVHAMKSDFRGRTPFTHSARLLAMFADEGSSDYEDIIQNVIKRLIPEKTSLEAIMPKLIQAATLQLDYGYITAEKLQTLVEGQSTLETEVTDFIEKGDYNASSQSEFDEFDFDVERGDDEDIDSLFEDEQEEPETSSDIPIDTARPDAVVNEIDEPKSKSARQERSELSKALKTQETMLSDLVKSGLMVEHRDNRYQFRYSIICAYLASLAIPQMSIDEQLNKAQSILWQDALAHATLNDPLTDLVQIYLDSPTDILHDNILSIARWMPYASDDAEWKLTMLRKLGNMFVAPNQFPLIRERVAAALVGTGENNTRIVFSKALRHPNEHVRQLACLGLGAIGDERAVDELLALMEDPVADVQLAAGLALGAIGTETALEGMVYAFTEGSEQLRQAIAEALAAIPEEGYPVLYDAIQHEDIKLRRAAVFGLRRVPTNWALVALYRVSLEDDQWYVRSAAEGAFQDMRLSEVSGGVQPYPDVESIPWLGEWIASLGEDAIEEDQDIQDILRMALHDNDPIIQELTVTNIGQLGLVEFTDVLYRALRSENVQVRTAAYRALGNFQQHLGDALPSPA